MSIDIRIGHGFDVHAFGDGDHVILGGVRVAHDRGVLAHSDGDVALHALCDAMLGALALGDIGIHFPPSDARWEGADSRAFVRHCDALIRAKGWRVGNCDITVVCERPKVGPHAQAMRDALREWPKGTWHNQMTVDGYDTPVQLQASVTLTEPKMLVLTPSLQSASR